MSTSPLLERLAALPTLESVPREQLEWLLEHGEVRSWEDGARFYRQYESLDGVFVVLAGRFSVRVDQEGVEREVREVVQGQISGHLPFSRIQTPRGFIVADGPTEFLYVDRRNFREMARECYDFTALCVHAMLDRVRTFKADDKQQEKMAALGRLSAGLAHELNNPTSAVARAASELDAVRADLVHAAREVGALSLGAEASRALERLAGLVDRAPAEPRSALEQADVEDELMDWLEGRGIDAELAYPMARTAVTPADLDAAAQVLDDGLLGVVLRYLAASAATRHATRDITAAAERIHSLVAAVKKHTHMDRAPTREPIRVGDHLADAVALMSAKAASCGVSVALSVDPELPRVEGMVVELNQVWMQLLDNALDAAPQAGSVSIEAVRDGATVVVRVVDDGPGIPAEHVERVWEPFFTTKDVGLGRGLGLDIVRTVIGDHRGTVALDTEPGRTEFRVTLPAT